MHHSGTDRQSLDAYVSQLSFAAKANRELTEQQAVRKERLKFRHPFAPAGWKLLHNVSELGIRAAQWTNLTWDTEYSKSTSALGAYLPRVNTRPIEMSLTRTAWVKLNRLRAGVGRFGSSNAQMGSCFFSEM